MQTILSSDTSCIFLETLISLKMRSEFPKTLVMKAGDAWEFAVYHQFFVDILYQVIRYDFERSFEVFGKKVFCFNSWLWYRAELNNLCTAVYPFRGYYWILNREIQETLRWNHLGWIPRCIIRTNDAEIAVASLGDNSRRLHYTV